MLLRRDFLPVLCALLSVLFVNIACHSDNVILDASIDCSHLREEGMAEISIFSDVQLRAKLYCRNNNFTYTMKDNEISLTIPVTRHELQTCQMMYLPERKSFEVYMSLDRIIRTHEENLNMYRMICEEDNTTKAFLSIEINNPFQTPQVIEHFYNDQIYIHMNLEVRNIYGNKLDVLTVYRKVQLYAYAFNVTGIQARECVMKTRHKELGILKGGCGTGCIFNKNIGFDTKGLTVTSPYFVIPTIISQEAIFSCKFRVCSSNCDGNSCIFDQTEHTMDDEEE